MKHQREKMEEQFNIVPLKAKLIFHNPQTASAIAAEIERKFPEITFSVTDWTPRPPKNETKK